MWTEENVQAVVNKACTEIDRLLVPVGGSDDYLLSHVEESDDMAEFMRVESMDGSGGRLDSPCFRLGAGEVRLHRPQRKSGGSSGSSGGIITVRQQGGGGGRFKCFAACCNQPLDQGCIHCDRIIMPASSSSEEVHFLNPAMRDSEVFSLNGDARQLARMLCMSFVGGRLYERYRHRHQQRRRGSGSSSSTAIPVNLHRELAMRFGKSSKLRDLSLLEDLKNCIEALTDVVRRQRKETADRKRLWQEGGGGGSDSDDNNYRKRFKQCLARQRNLDAVDAARLRAKQEGNDGSGGDDGALWTAIRLYMPDRWEDGGFARHYDYTMDLDGRLESEIKNLREANLKEASAALWKWGETKAGGGGTGKAGGEASKKEEVKIKKEATQQKVEELCREIGVPQLQRRIEVVVQKEGNGGGGGGAVVRFNVHSYDR